jgi:hypothetical protein
MKTKKQTPKQIESSDVVTTWSIPPLTAKEWAGIFDNRAEQIRQKRNPFTHHHGDPDLKTIYALFRQIVDGEHNRAITEVKDCPALWDVPALIGNDYYTGMINLEDYCKSCAAMLRGKDKRRPKLGKTASLIYEKLLTLPEHKAMQLPEIVVWLWENHEINLADSTVHQKHLTQLEAWGLQHDTRIGYSIDQNKKV